MKNVTDNPILPLEIIYQDDHIIAVNKPCGHLVHKSRIARDATHIVLQILRDQIGRRVSPVHRLDRKTSGVLLFAFESDVLKVLNKGFEKREVGKLYHALVRGWTADEGQVDYPLINDSGKVQEAITNYKCIERYQLPTEENTDTTRKYSLVEVSPVTGRMHQIRKHFNHLRHPIIGDRPHGCNKQNRFWKSQFDLTEMLLHAKALTVTHPVSGNRLQLDANYQNSFRISLEMLSNWKVPQ